MQRYKQYEARRDIQCGFAVNGDELYQIYHMNGIYRNMSFNEMLGHVDKVAVGYGKYGINCGLVRTSQYGYVAFPTRSSALMSIF